MIDFKLGDLIIWPIERKHDAIVIALDTETIYVRHIHRHHTTNINRVALSNRIDEGRVIWIPV